MVIKILFLLLIILVVFLFLVFFRPWHLHVIFKNNNLTYNFCAKVKFLFLIINIKIEETTLLKLDINIFSKKIKSFTFSFNGEDDEADEEKDSLEEDNDGKLSKIKEIYPLLLEAKEDLMDLVRVIAKIVKFDESYAVINLGVYDNNLTIKICNILWALTAPLYPLNFRLYLTPEIDNLVLNSDINVKLNIFLFHVFKIVYILLSRKSLRNLINFFLE